MRGRAFGLASAICAGCLLTDMVVTARSGEA